MAWGGGASRLADWVPMADSPRLVPFGNLTGVSFISFFRLPMVGPTRSHSPFTLVFLSSSAVESASRRIFFPSSPRSC